jgi:hypothetical protein
MIRRVGSGIRVQFVWNWNEDETWSFGAVMNVGFDPLGETLSIILLDGGANAMTNEKCRHPTPLVMSKQGAWSD